MIAPTAELFPAREGHGPRGRSLHFGRLRGGGAAATVEGDGALELKLDGEALSSLPVAGAGLYELVEHPRHESHRLAVDLAGSLRLWSVSFSPGLPERGARRASLSGWERRSATMSAAGGDPRRRRDPGRHQLPPRDRLVPGFRDHGTTLPVWRIHRHIGMGGDQLVAALAGDEVEERARRRSATPRRSSTRADRRGRPLRGRPGADRGAASTRRRRGARQLGEGRTRSSTTSTCSTPASWSTTGRPRPTSRRPSPSPTSSRRRWRRRDGGDGGDDRRLDLGREGGEARRRRDVAVLTGGFSERGAADAGAVAVFESVAELRDASPRRRSASAGGLADRRQHLSQSARSSVSDPSPSLHLPFPPLS